MPLLIILQLIKSREKREKKKFVRRSLASSLYCDRRGTRRNRERVGGGSDKLLDFLVLGHVMRGEDIFLTRVIVGVIHDAAVAAAAAMLRVPDLGKRNGNVNRKRRKVNIGIFSFL